MGLGRVGIDRDRPTIGISGRPKLAGVFEGLPAGAERGVDEISQLSRQLNRMARSLDRSLSTLRQREEFLDAVINSADDGIVVVEERLRVVTANRAYASMRNETLENLVNTPCTNAAMRFSLSFDEGFGRVKQEPTLVVARLEQVPTA